MNFLDLIRYLPLITKLATNISKALEADEKSPKGNITKAEILNILKDLFVDIVPIIGNDKVIK
jgi:hypothetical protein